ncbi:MAG: hypothetical protein Q4D98_05520 [Planctomycetia bacterium]|nr:hypothetical protein [Planctomycetia bacterium]
MSDEKYRFAMWLFNATFAVLLSILPIFGLVVFAGWPGFCYGVGILVFLLVYSLFTKVDFFA